MIASLWGRTMESGRRALWRELVKRFRRYGSRYLRSQCSTVKSVLH